MFPLFLLIYTIYIIKILIKNTDYKSKYYLSICERGDIISAAQNHKK